MKHLWINIDKCKERKFFMENQFNKMKKENIRIQAITPLDFDNILVQKRPLSCNYKGCDSCEYEFACISSHIKAMVYAINNTNDEWFVIMEDDMITPFNIDYENMIKDAPGDADIIQLHILYGPTVKLLYDNLLKKNVRFIKWQYLLPSAGMYIISRKGAKKLVNKFYINGKYDFSSCEYQIVADVALYSTVTSYATTIPYGYPNIIMGSTIHPDHLNAHALAICDIKEVIDDALSNNRIPYIFR